MRHIEIFNKYFKKRAILFLLLFIVATGGRYYQLHHIDWDVMIILFSVYLFVVFTLGFMDYHFYEKTSKKIILKLLNQTPLKEFRDNGFLQEEQDKIWGYVDDFRITLAPLVNSDRSTFLAILIPIKIREGLDDYFLKFNDYFKLNLRGEIVMVEAVIKNYDKLFDHIQLFSVIKEVIYNLKQKEIEPLEIAED